MTRVLHVCAFVSLIALLTTSVALAYDCRNDPANLLKDLNCDFDLNVSGWTILGGAAAHAAGDGDPLAGSAESSCAACTPVGISSACAAAAASTLYGYGVRVKDVAGGATLGCGMTVNEYSSVDCSGAPVASSLQAGGPSPVTGVWTSYNATGTTTGTTQSLRVDMGCQGSGTQQIRMDNVYFGVGITLPVDLQSLSVK